MFLLAINWPLVTSILLLSSIYILILVAVAFLSVP